MTAFAVIGRNSSGGEGSIKECGKDKNGNELEMCEPLGPENGDVQTKTLKDVESKLLTEKTSKDNFDYNTIDPCLVEGDVINYYAPSGVVGVVGRSWSVESREESDGVFEEASESSVLSIPPLQSETLKPFREGGTLCINDASEMQDFGVADFENGKFNGELTIATIEDLRKANSKQRQQCGALLAICRELEEGQRLAEACASLICVNSGHHSHIGGSSSPLGPYQQWLAREMAWSVRLPSSIGSKSRESQKQLEADSSMSSTTTQLRSVQLGVSKVAYASKRAQS